MGDPSNAYTDRGLTWGIKGDLDRAIADWNEAIRLDPKYADAYYFRGIAWRDKGDLDRAIADYNQAIRLDPKDANAYNNRGIAWRAADGYYNRGIAWRDKGDLDRAIADYNQAIRLDPKNADAYNNRCWARATAGRDIQQALSDCDEALRLRPNDALTMGSRGFVYFRLNRLDDAIANYDASLKINSGNAYSLYGRGIAKLLKGDTAAGNADITAAKAAQANIAEEFAKYDIKPKSPAVATTLSAPASPPVADCARVELIGKAPRKFGHSRCTRITLHAFPPVISPRSQRRASRR